MVKYIIDPLHSDVYFKVKHLMISNVIGNFGKFYAEMESLVNDSFEDSIIYFEADVNSISTNISDRDNHLKSPDFFDCEKYPKIIFKSTSVKGYGSEYEIVGDLTIKGVSKSIVLNGSYNGNDIDSYGQTKYGFELSGSLNRSDYGLTFNIPGAKGSMMVGEEVKLVINVQMIKSE